VPIGDVVDELLADDLFAPGIPIATLIRTWPALVGEGLAKATTPVSLDGTILTVRASDGPWGAQARYFTEQIRARADTALGEGSVTAVRIVVAGHGSSTRNRRSQG
jgi:predicted nucleic acid-binding Zn ribbon protein